MVDTPALGAGAARHGGSSPLPRTHIIEFFAGGFEDLEQLLRKVYRTRRVRALVGGLPKTPDTCRVF